MEKISQVKLTIFEPVFKGYHECFRHQCWKNYIVRGKRGRLRTSSKVIWRKQPRSTRAPTMYNANGCLCFGPWLIGSIKFRNQTPEFGNWTYRKVLVRLCSIAKPIGKQLNFSSNSIEFDWVWLIFHSDSFDWLLRVNGNSWAKVNQGFHFAPLKCSFKANGKEMSRKSKLEAKNLLEASLPISI